MLSQATHNTPTFYFSGYESVWKRQQLKEIADFLTGYVESKKGDVFLPISGYSPDVLARTKCDIGGGHAA